MASRLFLLLCTLLVLHATQAKLEVLSEPSLIVANPEQKINLKCSIQNVKGELDLKKLVIQWFHRGQQVAEFDDVITIDKPLIYSMSMDAIKKGDGTLTLKSFKAENAGFYRCYVTYVLDSAIKQIEVKANVTAKAEDDHLTSCETVLDRKLDKVLALLGKVDTKLEELSKACASQSHPKK